MSLRAIRSRKREGGEREKNTRDEPNRKIENAKKEKAYVQAENIRQNVTVEK